MNATPGSTIRDIVAADFRAAAVLYGYGIDFCCGGAKTVAEACRDRKVCADEVLREITRACRLPDDTAPRFADWDTETLISYIVSTHHDYVRRAMPVIGGYARKIASVHGDRHPELVEVARIFADVAAEMTAHMAREEQVLFPYIAELAGAARTGERVDIPPFGTVDNPIRVMEADHEATGGAMALISQLTSEYTPPADACTTYRICLQELKAFERDLHRHVHLENNLLFPRARSLASLQTL
jgi:regulator of cell morphogenesis and NO signaling